MSILTKFRSAGVLICAGCLLLGPNIAFAQKSAPLPSALISSEIEGLNSFLKSLEKLGTETDRLEKNAKVTGQEKKNVAALSKQLKDEIPSAKRNLESVIETTKSRGKWTPALDTEVIEEISGMDIPSQAKTRFIELVKRNGGAMAVLEKGIQALSGADAEKDIDDSLRRIEQKQSGSWLIGTAYAKWGFWKCIGVLAVGVAAGMAGQVGVTYGSAVVATSNCFD
jgi:hypothetical protein